MKGTIVRRWSKYSVVVDIGRDEFGKRVRKWHSGYETKREAEAARIEILSRLATGEYVPPNKITVQEWLTTWLESRVSLAETTIAGYEVDVRRVVKALGPRRLRDLTPALLNQFYAELSKTLAPKTVRNCHGTLHGALSAAVRQGVIPRNVADHVELPRSETPEMQTWSSNELRRFLSHAESHRLYPAFVLACSTGMRRSETLGLRWRNLDLDSGRVSVVDTVVPLRGVAVLRIGETKSRRSRRVNVLDKTTVAVLRAHRKLQSEKRLAAGDLWNDLDLVFSNERGEPMKPDTFTRTTKRLAVEAGVTPLTPHGFRHKWATLALEAGVPMRVVQQRLGHSSIAITADVYSHVSEEMDRDAAEMVAELIW